MPRSDHRIAVSSCWHTHPPARVFAEHLRRVKDYKPSVYVMLGDAIDADAASVHPVDAAKSLLSEYKSVADLLRRVREACPKGCRFIRFDGNHDDNVQVPDPRRVPKAMREAVNWQNLIGVSDEYGRWETVPYVNGRKGTRQVGPVVFYHGFECGSNSDFTEAAKMHYATGSRPDRLFVRGHTHRPLDVTRGMVNPTTPMALHYMNVGHLGPEKPQYMARRSSLLWAHGMGLIETKGATWQASLIRL